MELSPTFLEVFQGEYSKICNFFWWWSFPLLILVSMEVASLDSNQF